MKIYKYMGADILKLAMDENFENCSFKCSFPKDFNDPYELFLTINYNQEPDLLATYNDTIGEIPQLPTTCFSKSPCVAPMWAHYATDHRGVVIEVDEELFCKHFSDSKFADVEYRDTPHDGLSDMLMRACRIGKPRYHFLLQQWVFRAAYFTKQTCWSYEQERRLIVDKDKVKETNSMMLLEFPVECISALIVGQNASDDTKAMAYEIATNIGSDFFELNVSKISTEPYFTDEYKNTHQYKNGIIEKSVNKCYNCGEPVLEVSELCAWCSIQEHHIEYAQSSNPLRMLDSIGHLEEYYKNMLSVGRKNKE